MGLQNRPADARAFSLPQFKKRPWDRGWWLHKNTILEKTYPLGQNFISSFLLFPKAISSFKFIYLTCIQDETTAKITIL